MDARHTHAVVQHRRDQGRLRKLLLLPRDIERQQRRHQLSDLAQTELRHEHELLLSHARRHDAHTVGAGAGGQLMAHGVEQDRAAAAHPERGMAFERHGPPSERDRTSALHGYKRHELHGRHVGGQHRDQVGIDCDLPLLCIVICQHMPWTDNCVELPDVGVDVQVPVDVSHLPVIIDHICSDVWRKDNAVELSVKLAILWMQLEVSFGAGGLGW